jgi:hypothetical protein
MMRQRRDEEVTEIAEEAYRGAERLINDHRDLLDEIANRLLVNEVIEHEEIAEIMAGHRDTALAPPPMRQPKVHPSSRPAVALSSQQPDDAVSRTSQPPPRSS